MPEPTEAKVRRVLENLFAVPGVWPRTPSPAPPPDTAPAPWASSRSMALRNYRLPPQGAVSMGFGLQSYPGQQALESFMMGGATDEEILSRFPIVPPVVMGVARQSANRKLRQMNQARRGR